MTAIEQPGRPSKYWDALERTTPIVQSRPDGVLTTTSMRIANGTQVQHKNVIELIRNNIDDFEEFGLVAFQTRPRPEGQHGGGDLVVAILNEEHATLLLTYMRNGDIVRDFKKRLVRAFYELRNAAPAPAMPTHSEALRGWAEQLERAEQAESKVRELTVPASAYNELVEAAGDYSVADASKVLSRDPNISIRERALFAYMAGLEWVFKRDGRWKAYRTHVDNGRLAEKMGRPFWHEGRGEWVNGTPTVRITAKGLADLHSRLGGSGQLALMGAVS